MTVKYIEDEIFYEPPAFRDVLDRLGPESVEERPHPQTGPKTQAGKDRSKRNSTRHGLSGKGVVLSESVQAEADAMIAQLSSQFPPQDEVDIQLIRQCAIGYARQNDAISQQTLLLTLRSEKAIVGWDAMRAIEVEELAARLRKEPGLTTAKLQASTPGTLWMIQQWKHLYKALKDHGDWTVNEQGLAQDLAGLLPSLRDHDPLRAQNGTIDQRIALVKREVRSLRLGLGEGRDGVESLERRMVIEGFIPAAGSEYRQLKRYEREARNLSDRAYRTLEARYQARIARDAVHDDDDEPIAPRRHTIDPPRPRVTPPRPPKPLLDMDDVIKAVMSPNPPANLMKQLEQNFEEWSQSRQARNETTADTETGPDKARTRAPRDHELDPDALQRREERRSRRKSKKRRR